MSGDNLGIPVHSGAVPQSIGFCTDDVCPCHARRVREGHYGVAVSATSGRCSAHHCWCNRDGVRMPVNLDGTKPTVRTPAMQAADMATAKLASGGFAEAPEPLKRSFNLLTQGHDAAMDALWIISRIVEELSETDRGSVLCYAIARYTNEGKAK